MKISCIIAAVLLVAFVAVDAKPSEEVSGSGSEEFEGKLNVVSVETGKSGKESKAVKSAKTPVVKAEKVVKEANVVKQAKKVKVAKAARVGAAMKARQQKNQTSLGYAAGVIAAVAMIAGVAKYSFGANTFRTAEATPADVTDALIAEESQVYGTGYVFNH